MKLIVDGLVIWEVKTGEADRVITILTKNGLLSAYARGSQRPSGRLTSPTSMLSFSNFELFPGKRLYTVDDALPGERYLQISSDIERYALAVYFCELLKNLAPVDEDAGEQLSLMRNALYLINRGTKSFLLIKSAFELRLMALSGYCPDLFCCVTCGKEEDNSFYLDMQNGVFLCDDCREKAGKPRNCNGLLLRAMRYIIEAEQGKEFSFSMPEDALRQLGQISSLYVETHIDRALSTRAFLEQMLDHGEPT